LEQSLHSQPQVVGCSEGKHLPPILLHLLEVSSELNQQLLGVYLALQQLLQLMAAFLALLQQIQLLPRVDYLAEELLLLHKEEDCSEALNKEPLNSL
jgi:hypothetical protein